MAQTSGRQRVPVWVLQLHISRIPATQAPKMLTAKINGVR